MPILYQLHLQQPEQKIWDMINVNIGAATLMCHIVLEDMEKRGRGAVINISSIAGSHPFPMSDVYSATKIYIDYISASLKYYYEKKGT